MIILSNISKETVDKAKEIAAAVYRTPVVKTKANHTGSFSLQRYEIGFVGQYHFAAVLAAAGIKHKYDPKASGRSEPDDVLVYINGVSYKTEVKTAGDPGHQYLALPRNQRVDAWALGIVAVRLCVDWTQAEVMGFLPRERIWELEDLDIPGTRNMRGVRLDSLADLQILLERCDKISV